ncbi:MAG: MBL fold metallo-hydrolase [Tetrasphaera sp.]
MRITHLGHACVLIEMADTRILTDPGVFTPDLSAATDLDAVIITHQHPDHYDKDRLPQLMAANPDARLIADPETLPKIADLGLGASGHDESTRQIGGVTLTPVGSKHALINEAIPIIANVGVRLEAAGEPVLYHPGDTLAEEPGDVDVLLFPLNAPWQLSREMTAFLRRIAAGHAIPIHDGLLSANGRGIYLGQARDLGCADTEIVDLGGGESREFAAPA